MNITGKLIIIGGAVDKGSFTEADIDKNSASNLQFFETGILKRIISESKHKENSRIEVITTASNIPKEIGPEYVKAFAYLDATNIDVLYIDKREEAADEAILTRLKAADVVIFTGGDQLRLTSILGGTPFHDILLDKYHNEEFVYAGTSAGAAAASNNMIYQGSSSEALLKGEVKITSGLGLIDGVVIDTHFVRRGRIGRLFQTVVSNPRVLGIGLGEDTGLLITNNNHMEAIGSGLVILVDGRDIKDTNLTQVKLGQPISINNLVVHVMSMNDTYNIETHKMQIHTS
ncbi:cyanophycinase [Flavobacterium sp. ALD4]|jgi:cyanophycinase|uniref:cyanophycinase n=1 Tax=Flavobacterium sp. ALD4 TaxID=2058314 RepID=UPI000C33F7AE|nr:cyanophycinase [Flavobacterium sp. ALD4]PKH68189.1 cyanophycinase [Flavobacterium sp. ALD4]